jgi:hypothetical protein
MGLIAAPARADVLRIEARLSDDATSLELRYQPPPGVQALPLPGQDDTVQAWWAQHARAADGCTELQPGALRLRAGCTEARVRVALAPLAAQARYEPANSLGNDARDGGVVGYVGYWLAAVPTQDLQVRLLPPTGGHVLWQGQWSDQPVQWARRADEVAAALSLREQGRSWLPALGGHQTVYLGRAPSRAVPGGGRLVHDPRLPAATVDAVEATLTQSIAALTDAFGEGPGGPVGVMMVQAPGDRFIGNVSSGRSMMLDIGADALRADVRGALEDFVRHEATHWWHVGVRRSDGGAPWIAEGNAEWWALRLGVLQGGSVADAVAELERALDQCLQIARSLPPRLRDWQGHHFAVYPCGMSLMALAQALRSPQGMTPRALADMHPREAVLDADALAVWAGPGFARVLDAPSFTTALADAYREAGWAQTELVPDTMTGSPGVASWLAASSWLGELMRTDCNGMSFVPAPDRLEVVPADGLRCRAWPTRGAVVSLEGVPALSRPATAQAALAAACAPGGAGRYRLGLADGAEVVVACPASLPPPPTRLRLDRERVGRWFGS